MPTAVWFRLTVRMERTNPTSSWASSVTSASKYPQGHDAWFDGAIQPGPGRDCRARIPAHNRGSGISANGHSILRSFTPLRRVPNSPWTAASREHRYQIALCAASPDGFTQARVEWTLVVNGINVGAQPYWNAKQPCSSILRHTGHDTEGGDGPHRQARWMPSGSVSAEDNEGIKARTASWVPTARRSLFSPARNIDEACSISCSAIMNTLASTRVTLFLANM